MREVMVKYKRWDFTSLAKKNLVLDSSLQVKEGDGKDDLLGLPVEPTGLEGAAFQSRVPNDKMTQVGF